MVIYLGQWWPFDSAFSTKMEMFNEVTNIILVYHMMTFTDWVADPETRYAMGFSACLCVCMNMTIHFYFLMLSTLQRLRLSVRKKLFQRKIAKL